MSSESGSSTFELDFIVDESLGGNAAAFEPSVREVLQAMSDRLCLPFEFQVNVMLTDETEIQTLNRTFRSVDSVTDVLSFPAGVFEGLLADHVAAGGDAELLENGAVVLGDIAVCVARAQEQAARIGHGLTHEIMFLVLHGALHLLGYDHMSADEEEQMTAVQRAVMRDVLGEEHGGE